MSEPVRLTASQRARATVLLLDLFEDLDALRAYADGRKRAPGLRSVPDWVDELPRIVSTDTPRGRLSRWVNVFQEELDVVKAARNTVAHALPIGDDDLASAVRIAARLLMYARVSGHPSEHEGEISFRDPRIAEALHYPTPTTPVETSSSDC